LCLGSPSSKPMEEWSASVPQQELLVSSHNSPIALEEKLATGPSLLGS